MAWRSRRCTPITCRRPVRTAIMEPRPRRLGRRPTTRVVCGDVIIAGCGKLFAAAILGGRLAVVRPRSGGWGREPAASISATLLCGGSNVGACSVTGSLSGTGGIEVNKSNWAVEGWRSGARATPARRLASDSKSMTAVRRNKICRFHQRHCLSQRQWFWHQRAWTCRGWSRLSRICRKYRAELGWSLRRRDINRRDGLDRY